VKAIIKIFLLNIMLKKIIKIINKNKKIEAKKVVSYGHFLKENPKATREERRKAIKRFLDYTR